MWISYCRKRIQRVMAKYLDKNYLNFTSTSINEYNGNETLILMRDDFIFFDDFYLNTISMK